MSFTQDDVRKLAHLARIALPQQPQSSSDSIVEDLNNILQLVEQINEVNTDGIEPMSHPLKVSQRLRNDIITEHHKTESSHLYMVPKVVE